MRETITISLPKASRELVETVARSRGLTVSEYVRQAIYHDLWQDALARSRMAGVPAAREQGVFTDDDVFDLIS